MNSLLIIYLVSLIICASLMTYVYYLDYENGEDITIASVMWVVSYSVIPVLNFVVSLVAVYFILELDKRSWNNGVYTILIKGKTK